MFQHKTVFRETVDGLNIKPDGTYVDCTLAAPGTVHIYCSNYRKKDA